MSPICPACGAVEPSADARFCGRCGTRLGAHAEPEARADDPPGGSAGGEARRPPGPPARPRDRRDVHAEGVLVGVGVLLLIVVALLWWLTARGAEPASGSDALSADERVYVAALAADDRGPVQGDARLPAVLDLDRPGPTVARCADHRRPSSRR